MVDRPSSPSSQPPDRRRWARRISVAVGVIGLVGLIYGFLIEPDRLWVVHTEIDVPELERPLVVAVLTDLHVGAPHIDVAKLGRVVDETNAAEPDVIVVLGDLVIQGVKGGKFVPPETIAQQLARLEAPLGVYAVLGNHDWWLDGPRVTAALEGAGITVLENASVSIDHQGQRIWIAGLADLWNRDVDIEAALAGIGEGEPELLLTHNPDVFPEVPRSVSLTLAGHTHGGQVWIPGLGPPIVPSDFGARYAAGHVVEDGRHLYVGTGVGTSILPVRFNVVPRVDVLHLK